MIDLKPILHAARQAADLTRRVQKLHLANADKGTGSDPVTIADYGSQAVLLRAISHAYPDDGILAEESGDQFLSLVSDAHRRTILEIVGDVIGESITEGQLIGWLDWGRGRDAARTWAIDPVDGTKGYVAGRRYSIAIALLEHGTPTAGVLACPGYPSRSGAGMLFYAQKNAAYVEAMESPGSAHRVAVSTRSAPAQFRIVESVERSHAHLERMHGVYQTFGAPLSQVESVDSQDKYAMIAAGDADLMLRLPRETTPQHKLWDHAAGAALVRAAGGVVTDVDGSPLDFSTGAVLPNRGMIVSNGLLHDQIVEIVQAALQS
ncbi:MAG: inositol monophosphatase family protein [bacterium]|nr:inositol monophosphatase family protein [bacterium]